MQKSVARRITVIGEVGDLAVRERVRATARGLGLLGWVRLMEDGTLCVHAEGDTAALERLSGSLQELGSVAEHDVRVEGHEQFAIRGVAAGTFVVQEHQATAHHFDVRLEATALDWPIERAGIRFHWNLDLVYSIAKRVSLFAS